MDDLWFGQNIQFSVPILSKHFRLAYCTWRSYTWWPLRFTDRSKAVVLVLVLLFVALLFILRGDLFYVLPCVIVFLCFPVLLALRLPRLGKRELILLLFVRFFDLRLFGFVCFLLLLVSGKSCGFVIVALPGLFSYLFWTQFEREISFTFYSKFKICYIKRYFYNQVMFWATINILSKTMHSFLVLKSLSYNKNTNHTIQSDVHHENTPI